MEVEVSADDADSLGRLVGIQSMSLRLPIRQRKGSVTLLGHRETIPRLPLRSGPG
jgi:hypothetical protein